MKKSITVALISLIALCGCRENVSPVPTVALTATSSPVVLPTSTTTPQPENTETPWPTLIYYLYPTITPDPNKTPKPTITAPPSRNSSLILPGGLEIEEYPITKQDVYAI